ncbi:MAG: nucleotide pyrophosphohydrolase [Verrucomicrobiota bacterium JB022]|nr:nucleotide pyrophosphohydrolase [Verrucomicrobiota bacterium JB022]
MADAETTVAELKQAVFEFAHARDWEQFHSPKNLSMALAAEAGELMEHFLWCSSEQSREIARDSAKTAAIREELADVVIYAMEFSNISGIDLAEAIRAKIEKNDRKYPVEKAKGKSLKYTEL